MLFYYVSCASKTFSALYSEQKHSGLANIIFYDNVLVLKTLIHDISATLKNKNKIVFLLRQQ